MKGIPTDLLYILMFVAILGLHFLAKRFGPQAPEEPAWDERLLQVAEEEAAAQATPAAASGVSGVAAGFSRRSEVPRVAQPRRRFARSSLMGTRREVQNAVVVAAILGPCRAFEPHDVRQ